MVLNKEPIEYQYWDGLNELCERTRIIIRCKKYENTSVQNEIIFKIIEFKEADIICDKSKQNHFHTEF